MAGTRWAWGHHVASVSIVRKGLVFLEDSPEPWRDKIGSPLWHETWRHNCRSPCASLGMPPTPTQTPFIPWLSPCP